MKQILLFLTAIGAVFIESNAQNYFGTWVKHISGHESSAFNNIAYDGKDIVANGTWFLEAEFEGIELPNFTSSNTLLVKMDTSGNLKWNSIMTGDGYETFFDMAFDSNKNIVLTGWSSSNTPITINGDTVFVPEMEWISRGLVASFSSEDGSLIWYKTFFSEQEYSGVTSTRLAVDNQDNIYIMGYYDATFKIDTFTVAFTQENYGNSPFVVKLNSDGNVQWVKTFDFVTEGYGGFITPRALKTTETELFLGFEYSKPLIINNETLPYSGEYYWNAIIKMSLADGSVTKVTAFGSDLGQGIKSLEIDENGNVVVGGFFSANSGFKIGTQTLAGYGESDGFIAKLDNQLNLLWLKQMGGEYLDQLFNINLSNTHKIHIGGGFDCYTAFKFQDFEVLEAKIPNSLSMFHLILDEDGNFEQSFAIYGENIFSRIEYRDAALVNNNLILLAGASSDSVRFLEDDMFFSLHDAAYLLRWDLPKTTSVFNQSEKYRISAYPNPASDKIIIKGSIQAQSIELVNMQGQILQKISPVNQTQEILLQEIQPGVYFIRYYVNGMSQTYKIQIVK